MKTAGLQPEAPADAALPRSGLGAPATWSDALPLGFGAGIAATLAAMALSYLAFGAFLPYWRVIDQDIYLAYEGLLAAGGQTQEYFDHTGYLAYLTLGWWYGALHWLGLLPVHTLAELPPASDQTAYDAAWTALVGWARLLSFLTAAALVASFALLLRRLVGNPRVAVLGAFVLAFSGGLAWQMRIIRTELLSASFLAVAALLVLIAARDPRLRWRPLLIGAASFLATLAVVAKVQAIVVVLALPPLAVVWGVRPVTPVSPEERRRLWVLAGALGLAALAAAVPTARLVLEARADRAGLVFTYEPLFPAVPWLYQAGFAVWILAGALLFARLWRVSAAETLGTLAAMVLGMAAGFLVLAIRYHPQNVTALLFPVEHLLYFAAWSHPELKQESGLLPLLLHGIGQVAAIRSFILEPTFRPTLVLEWFLVVAVALFWMRGDRRLASSLAATLAIAWGIDIAFTLRSLKIDYYIYTDPLVVAAATIAFTRLPPPGRRARLAGGAVLAVMVVASQIEPEKLVFAPHDPSLECSYLGQYAARLPPFPFCPAPQAEAPAPQAGMAPAARREALGPHSAVSRGTAASVRLIEMTANAIR